MDYALYLPHQIVITELQHQDSCQHENAEEHKQGPFLDGQIL